MKRSLTMLAIVFSSSLAFSAVTLDFEVADEYLVGEPIMIRYSLKNDGAASVTIPYAPGLSENSVLVKIQQDGKQVPFRFQDEHFPSLITGISIKPNAAYVDTLDLASFIPILGEGTYEISVSYVSNGKYLSELGIAQPCWAGTVTSRKITVRIERPQSDSEKIALSLIRKGSSFYNSGTTQIPAEHALGTPRLWAEWNRLKDTKYYLYAAYYQARTIANQFARSTAPELGRNVLSLVNEIIAHKEFPKSQPALRERVLFLRAYVTPHLDEFKDQSSRYQNEFNGAFPNSSMPEHNLKDGYPADLR